MADDELTPDFSGENRRSDSESYKSDLAGTDMEATILGSTRVFQRATDKGPETDRKKSGKSGNGRWRPETAGKCRTDMAEFGSKSQEDETHSDISSEDSSISRRRGLQQQVRAEVHAAAEGPATDRKKPGNCGNSRWRPETTGKHQTSTAESGSRSRGRCTDAQGEVSMEDSDDDTKSLRRRRSVRVRSEICVPNRSQRRGNRVRFSDLPDDSYFTCVSEGEDDAAIDPRDDVDSRRTRLRNAALNGDTRVSSQGGESHGGKCVHSSRREPKGRKHGGPDHRENWETTSESEADSHLRSHRSKVHGNRRSNDERDDKLARKPHVSRRRRSPQSSSSERELVKQERKVHKHVSGRSRHSLVNVKLGKYDGSTCLPTFLAKFENCSQYYSWNEGDRLFQLRASLEGPAGQILWDASQTSRVKDIIRLLRARFGSDGQTERFRAELKARRRRTGESLQSLYQDVCRLLALAYPGPSSNLLGIVGRDAFLDALDDPVLRIRILEWEPKDLDEALQLACRLEAYGKSATPVSETVDGD